VEWPELDAMKDEPALGVPSQRLEAGHHLLLLLLPAAGRAQPPHLHFPPPVLPPPRLPHQHLLASAAAPRAAGAPELARLGVVGPQAHGVARRGPAAQGHRRLLVREAEAAVAAPRRGVVDQVRRVGRRRRERRRREPPVDVQARALHQLRHLPEPAMDGC
jgi:hypothetical protein